MEEDTKKTELMSVDINQLPEIVKSQFGKLKELEDKVKHAVDLADKAKNSASDAKGVSVGLFHGKTEAIKQLQDAAAGLADAQISAAEAQKLLFEYQTMLAEITTYLFLLGASDLAMNRCLVRELELRLKGAAKEEISDLAKRELKNVIADLKAREDMMRRQQKTEGHVHEHEVHLREHDQQLDDLTGQDEEQDRLIADLSEQDEAQDRILAEHTKKDQEHDQRITELTEQDEEQDRSIADLREQDEAQDRSIADLAEQDEAQDRILAEHSEKDVEHDQKLAALNERLTRQERTISDLEDQLRALTIQVESVNGTLAEKAGKTVGWVAVIIGLVGAALALFHYFL